MKIGDIRAIDRVDFFKLHGREQILFLLRYAVLAPSTHNVQPWLFEISDDSCAFYFNPERMLPQADPKGRDLFISMGCAIENFIIAAKHFSVFKEISYCLGQGNCVANVFLSLNDAKTADENNTELLQTIPRRMNTRGIFESEAIPTELLRKSQTLVKEYGVGLELSIITEKSKINAVAELTAQGLQRAYHNSKFRREMSRWFNTSLSKRKEGIPAYSLRMPFLISLIFSPLVRMFDIGKGLSLLNHKSLSSAPGIFVLSSTSEAPESWVLLGQLAERLMLEIQSHGLQTSIFVASIEMGFGDKVREIAGSVGAPQFLFAVGRLHSPQKYTLRFEPEVKLMHTL